MTVQQDTESLFCHVGDRGMLTAPGCWQHGDARGTGMLRASRAFQKHAAVEPLLSQCPAQPFLPLQALPQSPPWICQLSTWHLPLPHEQGQGRESPRREHSPCSPGPHDATWDFPACLKRAFGDRSGARSAARVLFFHSSSPPPRSPAPAADPDSQ